MARKWTYHNKRLKGAFGETDYDTKTITIDKNRHRRALKDKRLRGSTPKKDLTIINTIVHEELHRKHPRMHERTVRKRARQVIKKLTARQRSRLYSKFA